MNHGILSSIMIDEEKFNPVETSGNLRMNRAEQQGIPVYQFNINPLLPGFRDILLDFLRDNMNIMSTTLTINKAVIDDEELLSAIRDFVERQGLQLNVRITDENYTLTQEDYDKLSFFTLISVDNAEENVARDNLIIQNGVFKFDHQVNVQPVIERRNQFDEVVTRNAFHITHELSDEEFEQLATFINNIDFASIELDYFNPNYYEEFLTRLQHFTNKTDIHVQLIGYLLEDDLRVYERLERFPYEIDVVYSTCHDMIEQYQQEPFTESRGYRSSIEGGGITSLGNYLNVLENVTDFENMVEYLDLSPLETAIFAKMQIDSEYIYDPDCDDENTDSWDNINLSQVINHEVDGKRRAVCLGFSTLYSAYLRRCGIPMFRYSTSSHNRNIGRIKDDEYGVDNICVTDITWDLPDQNDGFFARNYFMVAPRDMIRCTSGGGYELLTVADTLALSMDECQRLLLYTNDTYEEFYHPFGYDPRGYTARLLELMGVAREDQYLDFYDTVYGLTEGGYLEGIPMETLDRAFANVLRKRGLSEHDIEGYFNILDWTEDRDEIYSDEPAINGVSMTNPFIDMDYPAEVLTPENVRMARRKLEDPTAERLIYPARTVREGTDEHVDTVTEDVIDNEVTIDEPAGNREPNTIPPTEDVDYVHQLLRFCKDNNVGIYNYYTNLGRFYRHEDYTPVPEFERIDPYLNSNDIRLLTESTDNLMTHYFASAMMRTISLNVPLEERDEYIDLFSRDEDNYNNAILEENNNRIAERIARVEEIHHEVTNDVREELDENEFSEEMIPGTDIHRPRYRRPNETDEEYVEFLRGFYERHFPNADYVQNVINYCQNNDINLYDYYMNVGRSITGDQNAVIPDFERGNPFISEEDVNMLITSNDEMMPTYFATSMMNTIGLNLSSFRREELQDMFRDNADIYNEEINRRV